MSAFSSALTFATQRVTQTENGAVSLSSTGVAGSLDKVDGDFVAFWNKLMQGFTKERIVDYVRVFVNHYHSCMSAGNEEKARQIVERLFVIWAETRDTRGNLAGKGWRDGSMWLFVELYKYFPETVSQCLVKYPEYGSWRDFNNLYSYLKKEQVLSGDEGLLSLMNHLLNIYSSQLLKDFNLLSILKGAGSGSGRDSGSGSGMVDIMDDFVVVQPDRPTLAGKWAPKQKSKVDKESKMCLALAKKLWPIFDGTRFQLMRKYRKLRVELNKYLKTTETFMCANKYSEIDFQRVPGRCMKKNTKAFLYQKKGHSGELRGEDKDRLLARSKFMEYIEDVMKGNKSIKGKQLYIHEIIAALLSGNCSKEQKLVLEAQWNEHFESLCEFLLEEYGDDSVPLVLVLADVSGSMSGIPMNAAIAMAIMFGQIMERFNPSFGNRFISFHEKPKWISLKYPTSLEEWSNLHSGHHLHNCAFDETRVGKALNLYDRAVIARGSEWGYNTDFVSCYELILKVAIDAGLTPDQLPHKFLVCSDMQFDDANRSKNSYPTLCSLSAECASFFSSSPSSSSIYKTTNERLEKAFYEAGIMACGTPYKMPQHLYWNLRGDTVDFPVAADKPNVVMISGFSVGTMKLFMRGKTLERVTAEMNSWQAFSDMLEDPRYEPIVALVHYTNEVPVVIKPLE